MQMKNDRNVDQSSLVQFLIKNLSLIVLVFAFSSGLGYSTDNGQDSSSGNFAGSMDSANANLQNFMKVMTLMNTPKLRGKMEEMQKIKTKQEMEAYLRSQKCEDMLPLLDGFTANNALPQPLQNYNSLPQGPLQEPPPWADWPAYDLPEYDPSSNPNTGEGEPYDRLPEYKPGPKDPLKPYDNQRPPEELPSKLPNYDLDEYNLNQGSSNSSEESPPLREY